jgi:hypothetical protein
MSNPQQPYPGQPGQPPQPNPYGTPAPPPPPGPPPGYVAPIPQQQPVPPTVGMTAPVGGKAGMTADPSTLAATGLLAAVVFAVGAGLINFLADPSPGGFRLRLLQLTNTVDVGDVALLGIAVALMLLTPDPPGGLSRPLLLRVDAALAAVIAFYGIIRSLVIMSESGSVVLRFGGFVATIGVSIAAATVGFYAAKESFLKQRGQI